MTNESVNQPHNFYVEYTSLKCLSCGQVLRRSSTMNIGDILTYIKHHECGKPMPTDKDIFGVWS